MVNLNYYENTSLAFAIEVYFFDVNLNWSG